MREIITILLLIASIILHVKSEDKNSNIISLKFKTYYPCSNNSLYNPDTFTVDDYARSIHLSKIYFEVGVGNETNFKSKTNQSINIIIDLKEIIFSTTDIYFEKYISENNNILCHYNTSKSTTFSGGEKYYKIEDIKSLSCYAKEFFQIYTDISLKNYEIQQLNFVNTINHNISNICGYIGLGFTHIESGSFNFLAQLNSKFNLSDYSFNFNYSNQNSDEGIFTFGNMPHVYLPKKFKYDNLISIYSFNNKEPLVDCIEILMEREGYKIDSKDISYRIKINPDIEGFEFPENTFRDLEDIFFEKYLNNKICHKEKYDRIYSVIYCDKGENKFNDKIINSFPNITINMGKIPDNNFTAFFNGKDLFYFKNDKYFFKIIEDALGTNIMLGRIFLKKYFTVFNQDKKKIYFYSNLNNKDKGKDKDKKTGSKKTLIIVIISCIICLSIFFPLGIYFGKKIYRQRNKKAYELNDGYDYTSAQDNKENFDIN